MKTTLDKMLTQVYELEGLMLVMQRHGDEVPALVVERLKATAQELAEQAQLLQVVETKASLTPVVELPKPEEEPEEELVEEPVEESKDIPVEEAHEMPSPAVEQVKPVGPVQRDITAAFSINDRFLFQRELFDGDKERFDETIALMQKMRSIDQIQAFMADDLCWNTSDEVVKEFVRLISLSFKEE